MYSYLCSLFMVMVIVMIMFCFVGIRQADMVCESYLAFFTNQNMQLRYNKSLLET